MDAAITGAIIGGVFTVAASAIAVVVSKRMEKQPPAVARPLQADSVDSRQPVGSPKTDSSALKYEKDDSTYVPSKVTLDTIVERLERHSQRATYGAVASLLDLQPYTLFNGRPFSARNAWVVAKGTGRPTGYDDSKLPPDFFDNEDVLSTKKKLVDWLAAHD
jgi:hypothetical protein